MSDALNARLGALERRLERLERRNRDAFALSRSTAPSVDSGAVQTNQGRLDALSLRDGMPTLYHYGFSASLPVGADKLVCFLNGDRSQGVVVATGHQSHRFTGLAPGEVVIHDMWGHSIHLTQDRISVTGDVRITGDLQVTGEVTRGYGGADQVALGTHVHTQGPDSRGDTEAAISAPVAGS
jgi:hypothetical protein